MAHALLRVGYEKKFMGILDFWFRGACELQKRVLLLTGNPGVGKTTVLTQAVNALKERGIFVGGMITREAREGGTRVGFEMLDLSSGRRGWLAHVRQKTGPQVGKYRVNLEDLNDLGAQAITDAVANCDVVAVDEVGPMELFSAKFKRAVQKALESHKLVIAVVHWRANDTLVVQAKKREDSEVFTVTHENRDKLPETIAEKAVRFLNER
jgi:nucleoside-triphosphatase